MPFLASTQNRLSRVLSTSGPNLVALEQFAPKSPFTALTDGESFTCIQKKMAEGKVLYSVALQRDRRKSAVLYPPDACEELRHGPFCYRK